MTRRTVWSAVALLVVAVAVTVAAERADRPSPDAPGVSVTRLGPQEGELVSAYVARTRAALADRSGGEPAYALVGFGEYLPPDRVTAVLGGADVARVLIRVPLPRVQTRISAVAASGAEDIRGAMTGVAADLDAEADQFRAGGDPVGASVATRQADQLRTGCSCVLAAVVRAAPTDLTALAERAGVRAVEVAPAGEPVTRLVFVPLLPEQRVRVAPPPDDGAAPDGR